MTRTESRNGGRRRPRSVLGEARGDLWKAALVVLGSVPLSVLAFQSAVWVRIKDDVLAALRAGESEIVAVTPLDVVLMQAVVGLAAGVLLALPLVAYYGRDALAWWPREALGTRTQAALVPLGVATFLFGAVAGYELWGRQFLDVLAAYHSVGSVWPITRWGAVAAAFALLCGLAAQAGTAVAVAAAARARAGRRR